MGFSKNLEMPRFYAIMLSGGRYATLCYPEDNFSSGLAQTSDCNPQDFVRHLIAWSIVASSTYVTAKLLSYNIVMKVIELAMHFLHWVLFCLECIVFHGRICFVNFSKVIGYIHATCIEYMTW